MASKKKVTTPEVTTPEVEVVKPKIGNYIIELILAGEKSNDQILEEVKAKFEACKTSYACVAWYKSKLRKEGKISPRAKKVVEVQVEA